MKVVNEFYDIDDVRLEVQIIKQPKYLNIKDTLVLLHEGLGCVEMWKSWPMTLARKIKVNLVIYSRIGMGKSSAEKKNKKIDFMNYEALHYLPKLVESYCDENPYLYGHSDGASISLIYAGNNLPCKALILEAPHVIVEDITIKEITKLKKGWQNSYAKEKLSKYHNDADRLFSSWSNVWLSNDFSKWNILSLINNISCPMLLIQGDKDQYGTIKQLNLIKKHSKGKVFVNIINNCRHSPHLEFPNLVVDYSHDFIQNIRK